MTDNSDKTIAENKLTEETVRANKIAASLNSHIPERHRTWHWNWVLIGCSSFLIVVGLAFSFVSYKHNSKVAADSFLTLATEAANRGDSDIQISWLNRYSMMNPDNQEVIIEAALVADAAVDTASYSERYATMNAARKQISNSIGRLDVQEHATAIEDLRKRLIERLIQLGSFWLSEAENQILLLKPDPNDAYAAKQLARAIVGQVIAGTYEPRDNTAKDKEVDYWGWLKNQIPGEVLTLAVNRNRDDLDLISLFLTAYHNEPQIFQPVSEQITTEKLSDRADRLVEESVTYLLEQENQHANWILYTHYAAIDLEQPAIKIADQNAETSLKRLTDLASQEDAEAAIKKNAASSIPDYYWDIFLLNAAARAAEQANPDEAVEYYKAITALEVNPLPGSIVEDSYLRAGSVLVNNEKEDEALAIWESGLVRDPNSIPLRNTIASYRVQQMDDIDSAKEAMKSLESAIELSERNIAAMNASELPEEQRTAATEKNLAARWQLDVLKASMDQKEGREREAIERLRLALNSSVAIATPYRVAVANQLADIYANKNLWDQAAVSLDRVSAEDPNNAVLRARIADAWNRAGNTEEAAKQWKMIGSEDTLPMRLAAAESYINQQLRLPPSQRDFRTVRGLIAQIRTDVGEMEQSEDELQQQLQNRNLAFLDVLETFLPSTGTDVEKHLSSDEFSTSITKLGEQYSDDRDIQIFVAQRLASIGKLEEASTAIDRLEAIEGSDATIVEITKAQLDSLQGNWQQASDRLLSQASKDNDREIELKMRASSLQLRGRNLEAAYKIIADIPDERQTVESLTELVRLAPGLPDGSPYLGKEKENPQQKLAAILEDKLRVKEGESGTTWKLLRVRRLIDELRAARDQIESTDPRFVEAKKLNADILSWRPRWGEAISLSGYLKAIEANTKRRNDPTAVTLREDAVEDLRRGVAAGDRQRQTRYLIVELLGQLRREDEAERELELATYDADPNIDEYSTLRINLANRQGDFDRGLALARAEAEQAPEDYRTHEVLARTAFLIGKSSNDTVKRKEMFDLTSTEIDRALELAEEDQTSLYSLKVEYLGTMADEKGLKAIIQSVNESDLSRFDKLMLEARSAELIGDDDQVLVSLHAAATERPSPRVMLSQAAVYRRLGRLAEATQILRQALKLAPNNGDVRYAVAASMIAESTDDTKKIKWDELAALMSQESGATNNNRLQHAVFLYGQGDSLQKREAVRILRKLIDERTETSEDAIRMLAAILREELRDDPEGPENVRKAKIAEVRNLYAKLRSNVAPNAGDIYQYCNFLLELNNEDDYPQIEQYRDELVKMRAGVIFGLEVGVRYAQLTIAKEDFPDEIRKWETEVSRLGLLNADSVSLAAGSSLLRLGRADLGLEYFRTLYENNPKSLTQYFVALVGAQQLNEAIDLAMRHYQENGDANSATLFVSGLNRLGETALSEEHAQIVNQILMNHENNLELLENVATLRLQHQDSDGAVAIFNRILKVDPLRIRTLNNMAMTLAELPGRTGDAMKSVDRAIKLAGEDPELLDTKGFVLMKSGDLNGAEKIFRQAFDATQEPRFQFHEILTLLAQEKQEEAKKSFQSLDVKRLNPAGLTLAERRQLETLKLDFRGNE